MDNKNKKIDDSVGSDRDLIQKERCVLCGCMTDIDLDTPIQLRRHYVIAAGQLCEKCFYDIYGTNIR